MNAALFWRSLSKCNRLVRFLPVVLALGIGVALSLTVFTTALNWEERQIEADFTIAARNRLAAVEKAIDENDNTFDSIRNFFLLSGKTTREEFHELAKPFYDSVFGIQAIEWIPRVADAERVGCEEAARRDGLAGFQITEQDNRGKFVPAGQRDEYFPVYFTEPRRGNETSLGFDLGSNPARLKAINEARDLGRAVATGRLSLVQETAHQCGFLLVLPVFAKNAPVGTPECRRENLQGFLVGVFRASDLVEQALSRWQPEGIDIHLIDTSAPVGQRLLYCPPLCQHRLIGEPLTEFGAPNSPGLHEMVEIEVGTRPWTILATPTANYIAARQSRQPWNLLAAGLMVTVLGGGFIAASIERNTRVRCLVDQRTRELRKSEGQYRQVFESVNDGLLVLDPEGRIVAANTTACVNHGYAREELLGLPGRNLVHPDCREDFAKSIEQLKPGEEFHAESTAIHKDGSSFSIEAHGSLILIDGEPRLLVGAHDTTKRKRAEEALEEREKRLSDIVANASEIIYTLSLDGVFTFVSPAWTSKLGHDVADVLGRKFAAFVHPDSIPNCIYLLEQLRRTGKIRKGAEYQIRHKDGSWRWHRSAASLICDSQGNPTGYVGVAEDITDRLRAEEALQQREKQLNDIVQNASETIYTFSPDGIFTFVSSAWTQNLGHDVADVVGHNFTEFVHPDDVPRCVYILSRMRTAGKPRETAEYRARHKDGSWRWHRTTGSVIRDSQGNATGYVGVAEDVTTRKQAELKLAEAKQAAEEANRAKSRFLANMSHEIRTPLTAIMGYADILVGGLSKPEDRQAAAVIKRNGEHLLAVINDILDLSKIEANRFDVDRVACAPCQILADVESLMSVGAGAKKLPLLFKGDGPLPETITSDPVRLRQILINLIGNAIKFTESGSVQVVTRLAAEPAAEPKLQIDVIDTGIGMSEQQVERLFQPFTQADNSMTRRFGGTGLGLLISKRLAVSLGGDISVSSAEGKGSMFRLTVATGSLDGIRCTEYPERVLPSPDQIAVPAPAAIKLNCRVLLAEDGFDNQQLISLLLRKAGAEVVVVENGQEAVDRVLAAQSGREDAESGLTGPFDIVLMDLQMPVMDGYEATRRLRKRDFRGPILALTAHAMPQDVDQCLIVGCNAHLSKPIDRDTLLRTVSRFLAPAAPDAALAGERMSE